MAANTLTETICKGAKPREKDYKLADGYSMYLFVSKQGAKHWRMAYRIDGKEKTLSIGPYPLISLKEARVKRDEARLKLLNKVDPNAKERAALTLSEAVQQYWGDKKIGECSDKTVENAMGGISKHIEPYLGSKPLNQITMPMMLAVLMKMDAAGLSVYVRKVRGWCGQVFQWGIQHSHCEINPARMIDPDIAFKKKEVVNFPAVELDEVPALLVRICMERLQPSVLACKLLALTWVRTAELRFMKWDQIQGDVWEIPKNQMKGKTGKKREHLVPLSRQALELLGVLKNMCRGSEYVFPAEYRTDRTITENCITDLFERIGYKGRMCGHGWRTVGSTWANSQYYDGVVKKFDADYVEMQLAHIKPGVKGVYDKAKHFPQRKVMLQEYADWLDQAYTSGMQRREAPALCAA